VRHWEAGLPLPSAAAGGRPCALWIDTFALCHQPLDGGWLRTEWPDGGPLLLQPWPQAAAFRIVADELAAIRAERLRSKRRQ
jgi:hypothetical protein